MFEITFYNENGRVVFGGGKSDSPFRVIKTDGLGFPEKKYVTVSYEDTPGQETVSEQVKPRTVTLSGDCFISGDYTEYSTAISVLNKPGVLEVHTKNGVRCIDARCTTFVEGDKKGNYLPFTVQFICDKPYFRNGEQTETPLYKVMPNLTKDFTFPDRFSYRITRRNILISSNAETEPVFIIEVGSDANGNIEIINNTSGEKLKLNYEPLRNECITVDVENRKIYNQEGDNLLSYLADDSFFNGFHLYPGENDCEVNLDYGTVDLKVYIRYNEKFLEAIC